MPAKTFSWKITGGQIALQDIDPDQEADLLARLQQVRAVVIAAGDSRDRAKNKKIRELLGALEFEYGFDNLDASADEIFDDPQSFTLALDETNSEIEVAVLHDHLIVTISVTFDTNVCAGLTDDEIDSWLEENGGPYAGLASGGWSYDGDLGQEMCVHRA